MNSCLRKLAACIVVWVLASDAAERHSAHSPAAAADNLASASLPVRSAQSGPWSALATWVGGKVPAAGDRVQIREGHVVLYDADSEQVIRSIHVAGTLSFAQDKNTRLEVGLIKVQPGDDASENGFDCDLHPTVPEAGKPRATLEVGSQERPIDARHSALIRLHYIEGMAKDSCPAIVCCGGRMDFHGAPQSRTWVKLGAPVKSSDSTVTLAEPVTGWRVGDRVIVTATTRQNKIKKTFRERTRDNTQTEERIVTAIDGAKLSLDKPLEFDHVCDGDYRGEIANLSRNVTVESALSGAARPGSLGSNDLANATQRGHTMFHRHSAGSISYAEFRHLGKEGVLGRYSLHFHLVGDTMRGSSVIGASIWDSGNRWLTIHGTNYLVVRDCVGYQSLGHGFFLEDGTEVANVLDRNLAVQAYIAKPLPKQVLPYDKNDGSGFWWANSRNTFTRNVACDCDEYGYFFQATKTAEFDPLLEVQQPDGTRQKVDIRTLPFIRFEDNEAHCQRRHSINFGGGAPFGGPTVDGVGPDERHPFIFRNTKIWNVHWAFHPVSPCVLVDGMDIHNAEYGLWRAVYKQHAYRNVSFAEVPDKTRNAFPSGPLPSESDYPHPLAPVDDLPPATIITHVLHPAPGQLLIRGTTTDNGTVTKVLVNGAEARAIAPNFAEWEITLSTADISNSRLTAAAEDAAGNREPTPHQMAIPSK